MHQRPYMSKNFYVNCSARNLEIFDKAFFSFFRGHMCLFLRIYSSHTKQRERERESERERAREREKDTRNKRTYTNKPPKCGRNQ